MQFLKFPTNSTLSTISNLVGDRNVEYVLATNGLSRSVRVGNEYTNLCNNAREGSSVNPQRKITLLNKYTQDSDVFESAALASEDDWKVISGMNTFPGYLSIPDTITLPDSSDVMGNGIPVTNAIYRSTISQIQEQNRVDPAIFNTFSSIKSSKITTLEFSNNTQNYWFRIPFGEVTLYSSLSGESIDFPAYPEELSDGTSGNYTTMPDLLYQYEPWQVFTGSGPRSNTYKWMLHRDMWSGDHNDGKANELQRFCKACCYARYDGSTVLSDIVSLYIHGQNLITGIMTSFEVNWSGPILDDGYYAVMEISIGITEVSKSALNFDSVRSQPLIG